MISSLGDSSFWGGVKDFVGVAGDAAGTYIDYKGKLDSRALREKEIEASKPAPIYNVYKAAEQPLPKIQANNKIFGEYTTPIIVVSAIVLFVVLVK